MEVTMDIFGLYRSRTKRSAELYERAKEILPAGVTYRGRHFDPYPFTAVYGKAQKLYDVDGNSYIDFWCGHMALILGHAHPKVVEAVKDQMEKGTLFGMPHEGEMRLAEQVRKMVPSAEMVRFGNSGTEAILSAVRLARAYTKRDLVGKFEGNWHGGYDAVHVAVRAPLDRRQSGGLTDGQLKDTVILPYNDIEGVMRAIKGKESQVAGIILEPVMGAGGFVAADKEFLRDLRELCTRNGILLIFDEIVTGFRLGPGGAQEHYGVLPDVTCLGKIVGGGLPIGAVVGRREIMERMDHTKYAQEEFAFQGGTFAANPLSMAAGYATLKCLEDGSIYKKLDRLGEKARENLKGLFEAAGIDVQVLGLKSMFSCHFTKKEIRNIHDTFTSNSDLSTDYHAHLLGRGIFTYAPYRIHGVLSAAHEDDDVDVLLRETEGFVKTVK
jgi:glutamate-1-semialdehyde 2,1-aminomutase